jgi:hypothetical protein
MRVCTQIIFPLLEPTSSLCNCCRDPFVRDPAVAASLIELSEVLGVLVARTNLDLHTIRLMIAIIEASTTMQSVEHYYDTLASGSALHEGGNVVNQMVCGIIACKAAQTRLESNAPRSEELTIFWGLCISLAVAWYVSARMILQLGVDGFAIIFPNTNRRSGKAIGQDHEGEFALSAAPCA